MIITVEFCLITSRDKEIAQQVMGVLSKHQISSERKLIVTNNYRHVEHKIAHGRGDFRDAVLLICDTKSEATRHGNQFHLHSVKAVTEDAVEQGLKQMIGEGSFEVG